MCNCIDTVYEKLTEKFSDISRVPNNYELVSGRLFGTYGFKTKKRGQKDILLMYSFCPHCGEAYLKPEQEDNFPEKRITETDIEGEGNRNIAKFIRKSVVIEAIQFTGDNWEEVMEFTNGEAYLAKDDEMIVEGIDRERRAGIGDWIIRDTSGEYFPVYHKIFIEKYEPVDSK